MRCNSSEWLVVRSGSVLGFSWESDLCAQITLASLNPQDHWTLLLFLASAFSSEKIWLSEIKIFSKDQKSEFKPIFKSLHSQTSKIYSL